MAEYLIDLHVEHLLTTEDAEGMQAQTCGFQRFRARKAADFEKHEVCAKSCRAFS